MAETKRANPFQHVCKNLDQLGQYYSLPQLNDGRFERLPFSIRVLLESAVRNCDEFEVKSADVENILNWETTSLTPTEVPFKPARVLLQDFTGVPSVVDLAAMRDAISRLGGIPKKINPLVPVDLVIDHSVQVDYSRSREALEQNEEIEFQRNEERFAFLKWGATAFDNMTIIPPGCGIVHQINLEYLARGVFNSNGMLYPDSLVGTDSHTTMIDGLGIAGWGVGGIEAEAVLLGQPISMVLPQVVGFKLTGKLSKTAMATDLVLTVTKMLRAKNVVGKFVEFYGDGCSSLTIADRATISNMSPEYGATMGYFPPDDQCIKYYRQTNRNEQQIIMMEKYLKAQQLYWTTDSKIPAYSDVMELDLSTVVTCLSGPKRPHDQVRMTDMKEEFQKCLASPVGFKGFGISQNAVAASIPFSYQGNSYQLRHGSVVISSITSCTNTSNPSVMLGAGLLAKNAVMKGLTVAPYIKTSLSPGSFVVLKYLENSGLLSYLEQLRFFVAGFGCMTCIGNSGDLDDEVAAAVNSHDLVVAAVLSGNRNFEGRVHPLTRANYLASPPLCVGYAIAGTVDFDFMSQPLGKDKQGNDVFLADIWPSSTELKQLEEEYVRSQLFKDCYGSIKEGKKRWNDLVVKQDEVYSWNPLSTYIHNPPFFQQMGLEPEPLKNICKAYCLLILGDSITTDHISPAGKIARDSPAAIYLQSKGVPLRDFNSYGSRRGNDEVMARGTFANIRLINKMVSLPGPITVHVPSSQEMPIYDAAQLYMNQGHQLIILAGAEYGSGSSRDWAAKGPKLLGVGAVIAQSFERIHRSNLVGMGILPLQFLDGQNADKLGLTGKDTFTISLMNLVVGAEVTVETSTGLKFQVKSRVDTEVELEYFRHGGILQYVMRKLLK